MQEDKLGLRWRTEAEVVGGKGQFGCGARGCAEARGLATFEVPFGYTEAGARKEALVKVFACSAQNLYHICIQASVMRVCNTAPGLP